MQPLTSTPVQPKRVFPSSLPTVRRASASVLPNTSSTSPLPPTLSKPLTSSSTSTGVPAFRSLRAFLPFGSKHTAPTSAASPPLNVSKSPFTSFGSVRRSMNRERKASLDVALPPVISIDQETRDELEESSVRRSVSLSRLNPTGEAQEGPSNPVQDDDDTIVFNARGTPILRTPSPGPPISADLSTILEADTSGISKHVPPIDDTFLTPPPISLNSPSPSHSNQTQEADSELDLSTSQLENQVLDAMRSDNSAPQQWILSDEAIVIDGEEELNSTFNLNALDADLADILRSPYRHPPQSMGGGNDNTSSLPSLSSPHGQPVISTTQLSPDTAPQYVLAPSPNMNRSSPLHDPLRSRPPRQQSSLPRLRPHVPSPTSSNSLSLSPSTVVPSSSASDSTRRGSDDTRHAVPSSPVTVFLPSPSSAPPSPATAFSPPSPAPSPLSSTPYLSRRFASNKAQATASLTPSPPITSSTISRLKAPFNHTPRTFLQRAVSSPGTDSSDTNPAFAPSSSTSRLTPRPSLDSTARTSGSFDQPRSSLSPSDAGHYDGYESFARQSIDALRDAATDSGDERALFGRSRKRSLGVQDRLTGRLGSSIRRRGTFGEADRDDHGVNEFGEPRSSSSLSGRMGRRWGTGTESESGNAPVTEWLGPRTVKAFRAAGLLDFDREQQDKIGSGSAVLSSSVGPNTHTRYSSMRSSSEYNPRAASRLALSEAGGSSASRRGSVSAVGSHGLMESPTFTVTSNGSRDAPRSASTAPTSVSGSSFGFIGRERDRDREEIRELKEKHLSETGALLGALSDSQRTTKVLRDENGELRERLEQAESELEALRRVVGELTKETGDLRIQVQMLKSNSSSNPRLGTSWGVPVRKSALSSSVHIEQDDDDDVWSNPAIRRDREHFDITPNPHKPSIRNGKKQDAAHYRADPADLPQPGPAFSSTPVHVRRFSTTSSIFPIPPANMTMLLHDNDHDSLNDSLDQSHFSTPVPRPTSIRDESGAPDTSVASTTSISPTNFSMTTGSPGSLFLRPEHEVHLGDMDSLDLGIRRDSDTVAENEWSD